MLLIGEFGSDMKKLKLCLCGLIVSLFFCHNTFALTKVIKIGTGSILKTYYSVGLDLCKTIESANKELKCEVVHTSGGIENLKLLQENKIDLALVQSNIAVDAYEGIGYYKDKRKMRNLRQILSLYDENFVIIARSSDKIMFLSDIGGKKISYGSPLSGTSITYAAIRKLYNFITEPVNIDLNYEDYIKSLCNRDVDVIMMMAGHIDPLVNLITQGCKVNFVSVESDKIKELIKNNRGFTSTILREGMYQGVAKDQDTISVKAILVAREDMDPNILDKFIGAFHRNVKDFRQSSDLFKNLDIKYFADTNSFVLPKHQAVRNR